MSLRSDQKLTDLTLVQYLHINGRFFGRADKAGGIAADHACFCGLLQGTVKGVMDLSYGGNSNLIFKQPVVKGLDMLRSYRPEFNFPDSGSNVFSDQLRVMVPGIASHGGFLAGHPAGQELFQSDLRTCHCHPIIDLARGRA